MSDLAAHPDSPPPVPVVIDAVPYLEVESILQHRKSRSGAWEYLVKFKDRPLWEAAWIPTCGLTHAQEILVNYVDLHHVDDDLSCLRLEHPVDTHLDTFSDTPEHAPVQIDWSKFLD